MFSFQVNVEMTYRTSKFVRTIPKQITKDYPDECSNPQYTHVATSVTYGLDAVFVFKRLLASHETEEQITGSLQISINKIPGAAIEGKGNVTISDAEKEEMSHTSLTMYGDFSPETPAPTTFEDAIEFYKNKSYMTAVTKGADGSVVVQNGIEYLAPAEKITPVDTNGAGDMFAGSFMHAFLQGHDVEACARFSNYASSKVVETFGPRLSSDGYAEVLNKL